MAQAHPSADVSDLWVALYISKFRLLALALQSKRLSLAGFGYRVPYALYIIRYVSGTFLHIAAQECASIC